MNNLKDWSTAKEIEFAKQLLKEKNELFQEYQEYRIANKYFIQRNQYKIVYNMNGVRISYNGSFDNPSEGAYHSEDDTLIVSHNGFNKSIGYKTQVLFREWVENWDSNKHITQMTYETEFFENGHTRQAVHRLDGPAEVKIKNMKTVSCRFFVKGQVIPKYLFTQNLEKIKYLNNLERDLYKTFRNFIFTTYLDHKLYIKVTTRYEELPVEDFNELINKLIEATDRNFNAVVKAGHENKIVVELLLKANPKMEMNKMFESSLDFFEK